MISRVYIIRRINTVDVDLHYLAELVFSSLLSYSVFHSLSILWSWEGSHSAQLMLWVESYGQPLWRGSTCTTYLKFSYMGNLSHIPHLFINLMLCISLWNHGYLVYTWNYKPIIIYFLAQIVLVLAIGRVLNWLLCPCDISPYQFFLNTSLFPTLPDLLGSSWIFFFSILESAIMSLYYPFKVHEINSDSPSFIYFDIGTSICSLFSWLASLEAYQFNSYYQRTTICLFYYVILLMFLILLITGLTYVISLFLFAVGLTCCFFLYVLK